MLDHHWETAFGDLNIGLRLDDGTLTWSASREGVVLTSPAPIRLTGADGEDLLTGLSFVSTGERAVHEDYELIVGKRVGGHRVEHRERTVRFRISAGELSVVLRAAADGVALRLVLHGLRGRNIRGGDVHLRLPAAARTWPLTYTPWYETIRFSSSLDVLEPGDYGFPFLAQIDSGLHVLATEADLDGRYGGALARYTGAGELAFTLAEDVTLLADEVASPWRVLIAGDLATIVSSHLVEDLAPAAAEPAPGWARPGRAAWSWWSDFFSGAHLDKQMRMLDYAAARGWEYVLVDCGWDPAWMPDLVSAASTRGIGVFVWVAWDRLGTDEQRRQLAEWASWGVAGIKVDFMESEAQSRYRWYDSVIAECRRVGLMINFHGSVIPRGWARTHPHVMSYEAVRGAEYYVFYGEPLTAEHNTILPYTRNVVGSADYTPVTFSAKGRQTTEAHELALAVVLESGLLHFADEIGEYQARPIAQAAIERIPAHWDETRLLGGRPGEYAVLARRSGDDWFIGAVAAGRSVDTDIDLAGLGVGPGHRITLIEDDADGGLTESRHPGGVGRLLLRLRPNGGALCVAARGEPTARRRDRPAVRVDSPLLFARPGTDARIRAEVTGGGEVHLEVPPDWPSPRLIRREPGADGTEVSWSVPVPESFSPSRLAVLAVHAGRPRAAERSVIAHVRVAHPFGPGETALERVRPTRSSNGFGPVEVDRSNGGGDPGDGRPMHVAGHHFEHGLGVCAPASITYAVGGTAHTFVAGVGIDDETPESAPATCRVLADGRVVAEVTVTPGEPVRPLEADITGARLLELVVEQAGAGEVTPHIDWIAPRVQA
ncbi:glycoside hydrolase family 97 catalytic domain-containing protein [Streptosporangium sp. NPDC048047]|uniref:glycoside hydrolase family 97 catalytic domain-containing protein n=1 Tax=Streptosporangium sp. NPDC048047 TaxID=3155748 RepID=UPI0034359DEF